MIELTPSLRIADSDVRIVAVRSRGPGGQNVNKVSSAAILTFDLAGNSSLPAEVRVALCRRLAHRLIGGGALRLRCERSRSFRDNRREVLSRFVDLLRDALKRTPRRLATKPTRGSRIRRRMEKTKRSVRKHERRDPRLDA